MTNEIPPIEKIHYTLLVAVIQAQDFDSANNALTHMGMSVTRLPSIGGFLGRRNENCRQRVEFIAVPLESAPLPMPAPTPVTIGGATVFSLDVDRYEEI